MSYIKLTFFSLLLSNVTSSIPYHDTKRSTLTNFYFITIGLLSLDGNAFFYSSTLLPLYYPLFHFILVIFQLHINVCLLFLSFSLFFFSFSYLSLLLLLLLLSNNLNQKHIYKLTSLN